MNFYVGLHNVAHAIYFERCMISVNRLINRKSDFTVNEWIMDSGAFSQIYRHGEHMPIEEYADLIKRWANCGELKAVVTQDYMCEPFILAKTKASVEQHQIWTIERYIKLLNLIGNETYLMPVLQGYSPDEYVRHIEMYSDLLKPGMWVGVGSVCKRNSSPFEIYQVLEAIKEVRPDLKLHGFGLKTTVFKYPEIIKMLYSADSMAWSYAGRRKDGKSGNDWQEAKRFVEKINRLIRNSEINLFKEVWQDTCIQERRKSNAH